jgi:hypothetical protein
MRVVGSCGLIGGITSPIDPHRAAVIPIWDLQYTTDVVLMAANTTRAPAVIVLGVLHGADEGAGRVDVEPRLSTASRQRRARHGRLTYNVTPTSSTDVSLAAVR